MNAPIVVILAAGQGTRMRSRTPKVLHDLCGMPMIAWPVAAAREAGAERIIVVDAPARPLDGQLDPDVEIAVQPEPNGTGGAVAAAADLLDADRPVVILSGDVPLVSADAIRELVGAHAYQRAAATVATTVPRRPVRLRARRPRRAAACSSASSRRRPAATRRPRSSRSARSTPASTSSTAARCSARCRGSTHRQRPGRAVPARRPRAAARVRRDGRRPLVHGPGHRARRQRPRAARARRATLARRRIIEAPPARRASTSSTPPRRRSTPTCELGQDTVVEPFTILRGDDASPASAAGSARATTLTNVTIGDEVTVLHSYGVDAEVRDGASVGPFAYLRPGTRRCASARRSARSSRSRTPTSARARRSRTSPTSATPTSGPGSNLGAGDDHRQLRRPPQAPHDDRRGRARLASHVSYVAPVARRRRRVDGRRLGHHRGRPRRRARHRARAPVERRGLRRAPRSGGRRGRGPVMTEAHTYTPRRRLARARARDHQPPDRLRQAAHAVLGPCQPGAGRRRSPTGSASTSARSRSRRSPTARSTAATRSRSAAPTSSSSSRRAATPPPGSRRTTR